ncbi:UAP56-interacting factor-like [Eublepharis macularius]|uniref:UAP56-interacting factor-like n=1 Tax=Eublepharis macularius TaxID=481883 RepID=A0AA97KBE3_EUBMA|nr:UAP56-interacting factor-like [Eublepharis macularius]
MEAAGGEQEPAAGAGSGPTGSEEIDLSLDDIIKRNKKGQTNTKAAGNRWRQQLKNRNPSYSNGRPRFRSWAPQSVQGAYRFRRGFRKQQYYRKRFWNGMTGPQKRTAPRPSGASPLNRPASAQQQVKQDETTSAGNGDGVEADPQQGQPTGVKRFRRTNAFPPTQRPFKLNRRPAFMQRQSRFNFSRGQKESNQDRKQPWTRRWQLQPSSGAVLTVSVSNPHANQMKMLGAKRPFLRGRSTSTKMTQPKPKGVPLRFNFRAMANQTSLTLNERFSGLRLKHRFTALRNTSRMVTLP